MQLERTQIVALKTESPEGTDATPGATECVQCIDTATFSPGAEFQNPREGLANQLLDQAQPGIPGGKYWDLGLSAYARGHGSAYSASYVPEIHYLLQAAGFSATGSFTGGSEKWTYDTQTFANPSLTAYYLTRPHSAGATDWTKHVLLAARVPKLAFHFRAGQPGTIEASVRGKFAVPTDPTAGITPTYKTTIPPLWAAASNFTLGALTAGIVRELNIAIDNTLTARPSGNAVDGLAGWMIGKRKITWDALIEADKVATYDPFTLWQAGTAGTLKAVLGATQYNKMTLEADKATITDPPGYQFDGGIGLFKLSGTISPEGTKRLQILFD